MRKTLIAIGLAALIGGVIVALPEGSSSPQPESAAEAGELPKGAPPRLAKVHAQANELLDGGVEAFRERLRELRGHPVVVNRWAAWCAPCRAEFPFFQTQALEHGAEVAFLGVDVQDNDAKAAEFLADYPVSFPSYRDPALKISAELDAIAPPSTTFYDSRGRLAYVHQGAYLDEETLERDIERYAR